MPTIANIDIAGLTDFNVRQGSPWALSWTFTDSNGNALDLTGYTFRLVARDQLGFAWVDQVPTFSANTVSTTVLATKTVMPMGVLVYELAATPPGNGATAWGYGKFLVQKGQL